MTWKDRCGAQWKVRTNLSIFAIVDNAAAHSVFHSRGSVLCAGMQCCSGFAQPLVLDGENTKNEGSVNNGFSPIASILQPKNNDYVTDYFLDLKMHFDLQHPLASSVTDVCIGMRMLRANNNNEDISTCENNIRNFVSEGEKNKGKVLNALRLSYPSEGTTS